MILSKGLIQEIVHALSWDVSKRLLSERESSSEQWSEHQGIMLNHNTTSDSTKVADYLCN
jgi:hypothetical protein